MLLNTTTEGNLLANFRASGRGQGQLRGIALDSDDLCAGRYASDVYHEHFLLGCEKRKET